MKKILLLLSILSLSYANDNRMATVSGSAFLNVIDIVGLVNIVLDN